MKLIFNIVKPKSDAEKAKDSAKDAVENAGDAVSNAAEVNQQQLKKKTILNFLNFLFIECQR